jgi:hypothetical protein
MDDNIFLNMMANGQKYLLQTLVDCNQYTERFGIRLSEQDALKLLDCRKRSLKEQERIEFGEGILPKLIFTFCDSPYVYQDNYVDTMEALQEIFYLYKNESLDELSDDELLSYMKEYFDNDCQGSLEYLEETYLDEFSRSIRRSSNQYLGSNQDE